MYFLPFQVLDIRCIEKKLDEMSFFFFFFFSCIDASEFDSKTRKMDVGVK